MRYGAKSTLRRAKKTHVHTGRWQSLGESNPSFQVENLTS
jgi:hypothetical protein